MAMIDRIKAICLKPNAEWPVIEAETTSTRDLMIGYVAPLAAITPIASFVGGVFIGRTIPFIGTYHVPLTTGLTLAVVTYLLSIVGVLRPLADHQRAGAQLRRTEEQRAGVEGRRLCVHAGLGRGRPHGVHLARHPGDHRLVLRPLRALPRPTGSDEEPEGEVLRLHDRDRHLRDRPLGGHRRGGSGRGRRGDARPRRTRWSAARGRSVSVGGRSVRQGQLPRPDAGDGASGAGEQQEDGRGAEERRPQRAGAGRDAGAGRHPRRRQARRSDRHRPAEAVRPDDVRRPRQDRRQRREERHGRVGRLQGRSDLQRPREASTSRWRSPTPEAPAASSAWRAG